MLKAAQRPQMTHVNQRARTRPRVLGIPQPHGSHRLYCPAPPPPGVIKILSSPYREISVALKVAMERKAVKMELAVLAIGVRDLAGVDPRGSLKTPAQDLTIRVHQEYTEAR